MTTSKAPRVALLFSQFSAYHIDRCEAVARRLAGRCEVLAVEVATRSDTYAWAPSGEVAGASKRTLFPGESWDAVRWPRRLLHQFRALWRCQQVFIGIGYNEPDIVILSWLLRLFGVQVYAMSESKFDDFQRGAGFELFKALLLGAYCGALVGGRRQATYFRFLGFRHRPVLPGYDTVSLERVRRMGGGISAPDGAAFGKRPFVFVGRFVEKKNLLTLVDGYASYAATAGKQARPLILIGSGPHEAAIRSRIAELGIESRVEIPGFLGAEAVAQHLASALALVLPSRTEQWGLVVNEALAFGLPAIVSTEVGARDALVRNGVNGFVVEPDSADGFASAMAMLGGDEAQWRKMVAQSHARAWLADTERLADAVELLIDPTANEAAARIAEFRAALLPPPTPQRHWYAPAESIQPAALADAEKAGVAAYWQQYYAGDAAPTAPSDFATFVEGRLAGPHTIIEVGCGNGRDALYFLGQGRQLRAIDASSEAIAACQRSAAAAGHQQGQARFAVGSVAADSSWEGLSAGLEGPVAVYARFLFHAIDDATEAALLDHACALINAHDGMLCAEFRTPADAALSKVAPAHYRRYVDPDQFCARLAERGMTVVYRREGQGMARYQSEDAHVVRIFAAPAVDYRDDRPTPGLVRLQSAEKHLASRFFDYCVGRGLTNFLVCGSALGAIRHGDIIPWDDDIDVGMLREDYDALIAGWNAAPLEGLTLQHWQSEPGYPFAYAKIRVDGTRVHENAFAGTGFHQGVFIDIFPFDRLPRSVFLRKVQQGALLAVNLFVMSYSRETAGNSRFAVLRALRRTALALRPIMPIGPLTRLREWLSNPGGIARSSERACFEMWGIRHARRTWIEEELLVPPQTAIFGGRQVHVPAQVEAYLEHAFGAYLELPPPDSRRPLHITAAELGAKAKGPHA